MKGKVHGDPVEPGPISILALEDDDTDFEILATHLSRLDGLPHTLTRATRLAETKQLGSAADLVLLDLNVEDSHGPETARQMLQTGHHGVVVLTGHQDRELAKDLVSEGAVEYLVKGEFDSSSLERSLRIALARRSAAMDLTRRREEFRAVADNVLDSIVTADSSGRITYANPATEAMFGWTMQDLEGESITKLMPERYKQKHIAGMEHYVTTGESRILGRKVEVAGRRKDGTEFPIEISVNAYELAGVQHFTAVLRDIELVKEAQVERELYIGRLRRARIEADTASQAKTDFVANMSHEIRTPMNAVVGTTDILLQGPVSPEQRRLLSIIKDSGQHLTSLLNDILDLAKIEAGTLDLDLTEVVLEDVVQSAVDISAQPAHAKGIEIAYSLDDDLPRTIRTDVARLRQVLVNLLANATKFTTKGQIIVQVSTGEDDQISITVQDSGSGVAQEVQPHIFDAFQQGGTPRERARGTGLGLSISRQMARALGGDVRLGTTGSGGSTFQVQIPLGDHAATPHEELLKGIRVRVQASSGPIQDILEKHLLQAGAICTQTDPDVQILDLASGDPVPDAPFEIPTVLCVVPGTPHDPAGAPTIYKPVRPSELVRLTARTFHRQAPEGPTATSHGTAALRILLVEDDPVSQGVLRLMLEQEGHRVHLAKDGQAAVAKASQGSWDVILMDIDLPDMDGMAATRKILEADPNVAIHAMTAHATQDILDQALAAGMKGRLLKPITRDMIRALADHIGEDRILDVQVTRSVLGSMGRDGFLELVETFGKQVSDGLVAMRSCKGDETARVAHRLKGASRTLGAIQVAALCSRIEAEARTGGGATPETLEDLQDAIQATLQALGNIVRPSND